MDVMELRRGLMMAMAGNADGLMRAELIIADNMTNMKQLADAISEIVPSFTIIWAFKESAYTYSYNEITQVIGQNNEWFTAIRYRNGYYDRANVAVNYDANIQTGEKYVIYFK